MRSPDGPTELFLIGFRSQELGFKIVFRNYSRSKLKQLFWVIVLTIRWTLTTSKASNFVVNRSLSNVELEIQRLFNAIEVVDQGPMCPTS